MSKNKYDINRNEPKSESKNEVIESVKIAPSNVIRTSGRCYTCKPRGKVKKHIISYSSCKKFVCHHDMSHRPIILVTPVDHIKDIYQLTPEELSAFFAYIKEFCAFWNIDDYQVSYNCGAWKLNEHFHAKIRINEKIAGRMRGDHFKVIKLSENYTKV